MTLKKTQHHVKTYSFFDGPIKFIWGLKTKRWLFKIFIDDAFKFLVIVVVRGRFHHANKILEGLESFFGQVFP